MFAALVNSLCLGLLNKFSALTDLSSLLSSVKSGILALGITVKGAKLSDAMDLTALAVLAYPKVLLA
jgi:type III secretory pathway component EscT